MIVLSLKVLFTTGLVLEFFVIFLYLVFQDGSIRQLLLDMIGVVENLGINNSVNLQIKNFAERSHEQARCGKK